MIKMEIAFKEPNRDPRVENTISEIKGCPGGSVKRPTLDFSSDHDLRVVRLSPILGSTLGMKPS